MGFLFKIMPEKYFDDFKKENPGVEIEFHDKFLSEMVDFEFERPIGKAREPIDLGKFVELL
jgi:hypothetical protein